MAAPATLDHLSTLADSTRSRLLLVLERHEMTVTELCAVLQLPQSTVSRHLKVLGDERWVESRAEGTSRFYRISSTPDDWASRLWAVVRESVLASPVAEQDRLRESRDGMLREAVRALEHWLAKGAKVAWTPYLPPSACRELLRAAGFYGADQLEHARAALASEAEEKKVGV